MRLTLPTPPEREELAAFWVTLFLAAGLVAIAVAVGTGRAWLYGVAVAAAVSAAAGATRPELTAGAYRFWNRGARAFGRGALRVVSAICFYAVFPLVRLVGRRALRLERPDGTVWSSRETLDPRRYGGPGREIPRGRPGGWLGSFLSWGVREGHPWVTALVPYMLILRGLQTDRVESTPSEIYTLY